MNPTRNQGAHAPSKLPVTQAVQPPPAPTTTLAEEEALFKPDNYKNWPDLLDNNHPETWAGSVAPLFGVSPTQLRQRR